MSLFTLALVAGILVGFMVLLVIFSLLTMSQRGDAYLEQLARVGEAKCRFAHHPDRKAAAPAQALPETAYPSPVGSGSTELT